MLTNDRAWTCDGINLRKGKWASRLIGHLWAGVFVWGKATMISAPNVSFHTHSEHSEVNDFSRDG